MSQTTIILPKIIFSKNFISDLKNIGVQKKCILFTSAYWKKSKAYKDFIKVIKPICIIDDIKPNPELKVVLSQQIDFSNIEYCVSLGGGSVLDFTKAVIAFYSCSYNKNKFNKTLVSNKLFLNEDIKFPKFIAIPTTSGTGSEINSWGTIWKNHLKLSVAGDILRPNYAILDASLCKSMPTKLTISTALDALSHSLESIWNKKHSSISDELASIAIKKIIKFLPLTITNRNKIEYRKEMQLAALLAGISMSQTKTAICHSISYPLTSIYNIPHGIACSLTLAEVAKLNNKKHKKRMKVIGNALYCQNEVIGKTLEDFLISINFKEVFKPYASIDLDQNINFINPMRAKNNLTKISNKVATEIVKKSIKKFS